VQQWRRFIQVVEWDDDGNAEKPQRGREIYDGWIGR
jgi:hypothetical protein